MVALVPGVLEWDGNVKECSSSSRSSPSGSSPRSNTATNSAVARLDISSLVPVVQELSAAGVAPSTRKGLVGEDTEHFVTKQVCRLTQSLSRD